MALTRILILVLVVCNLSYGLATEYIGPMNPDRFAIQPGWATGIEKILLHHSPVYSIWVNGNENFYFEASSEDLNTLLKHFSEVGLRERIVQIKTGSPTVNSFDGDEFKFNISFQIVEGIARHFALQGDSSLPLDPLLTLHLENDIQTIKQLTWPKNLIVETDIPDLTINPELKRAIRTAYYGKLAFANGDPPVEFVKGVQTTITQWQKKSDIGIQLGKANNKGLFRLLLSETEKTALEKEETWLTITIGNFLVRPEKSDFRYPAGMLVTDPNWALPLKVNSPNTYHGRILFEDGSPPILDPSPWPGAEISIDFPYSGMIEIDDQGYFKVSMTQEQYQAACKKKPRRNIYVPDMIRRGRSTGKHIFPMASLSPNKAKAETVTIPRPKLTHKPLTEAPSIIGQNIPDFNTITLHNISTEELKGRPLLICFWDLNQRPSRQYLQSLTTNSKEQTIIAIHAGTTPPEKVKTWFNKKQFPFALGTIAGDPYETLFKWGARGLPWSILTDPKHSIIQEGLRLKDAQ